VANSAENPAERAQSNPAEDALAGCLSRALNVLLALDFHPFPGPPRPVFFRLAPLVLEKVFLPALLILLGNHHRSIIAHDNFNSRLWTANADSLHSLLAEAILSPAAPCLSGMSVVGF
jgi:hypothetical protein